MAQKRKEESEFKVSDKRLFTADGDLRTEAAEEQAPPVVATATAAAAPVPAATPATVPMPAASAASVSASPETAAGHGSDVPEPPTDAEQQVQHDAYKQSSRDLDTRVELSGHSAKELEMTFERFMASLYMTAMMQLGLMHEQGGQPGVDIIGARQTIDTLGMIADKTKGNLTPKEQGFLQNCLYELRMAYVEVTNALARPPQAPGPITGTNG
ncbi:MAG: DUF1844 domain-containing protein [Terriglobales bacterium]